MPITADQIDYWRSLPSESNVLEFKEAKNQFDNNKLYSYCVAIANEGGGHLLLGIKNVAPRMVVGTNAFNNPIEMASKIFEKLGFRVDIEAVAHPAGRIVVFQIPSRPRGTAFHLDGAYLMRSGESLVPMSEDRLRRIFSEGEPNWLEEPATDRFGTARILELLDTVGFFSLLHRPYPESGTGIIDQLLAERLIDDEGGGAFVVRRLAARGETPS